ncbi:DMT family transporter, partial [Streptomyces sp. NPDC001761]
MSALALSVLLSVVSALAYAGGAIVQEQVAVSSPDSGVLPLRRPGWWGALALNGLGGVLHVVALAYGPLSLVQPLGALTIVFALPLAALCVGRRAGATAWRGALMATVGLAGLLSLVGSSSAHSLAPAQRLAVALVTGGAVVALMFAGLAAHRHPAVRSVLLATASGIAFGMSSVFTKTVAVDWSDGIALGDLPSLAVIVLFAVAGVLLSQASYRGGGLAAPLATLTVVNPVLAAAVGILMFGETFRYGTTGTALALGCGVVAAGGLIMLTTERLTRETAAAVPPGEPASVVPAPAGPFAPGVPGAQQQARLTVPQPREGGSAGTERGGRAATGTGAAEPGRPGVSAFPAGPGEPLRAPGAAAPVRAGAGEPAGRTGPTGAAAGTEAGVRAGAAETVVRAAAGVRAEEAEPVTPAGAGPADPARGVTFPVVGMVGGGQLARMTHEAGIPLGIR